MNIQIDKEKLKKEINRSGRNMAEASKEMGFNANYLACVRSVGYIPESSTKLIDFLFGIPVEKYQRVETPEQSVAPEYPFAFAKIDFGKVVYEAVYNAVKDAWKEM